MASVMDMNPKKYSGMGGMPRFARKPGMAGANISKELNSATSGGPMKGSNKTIMKISKTSKIGALGGMKRSGAALSKRNVSLPKKGKIAGYTHATKFPKIAY